VVPFLEHFERGIVVEPHALIGMQHGCGTHNK
jgi:hypothetical protein